MPIELHHLSLPDRPDWQQRREITLTLPPKDGFHPTIVMVQDHIPLSVPMVLQQLIERRKMELFRTMMSYELLEHEEVTMKDLLVECITYKYRMAGRLIRNSERMWIDDRYLMSVRFGDDDRHFDQHEPLFNEWLDDFGWTKDPGDEEK